MTLWWLIIFQREREMMIGYNRVGRLTLAVPKQPLFLMRQQVQLCCRISYSATSTLGIMRERHNMWERRAPLSPRQVNWMLHLRLIQYVSSCCCCDHNVTCGLLPSYIDQTTAEWIPQYEGADTALLQEGVHRPGVCRGGGYGDPGLIWGRVLTALSCIHAYIASC